jgi:RNA-directed DNA polymerase
MGPGRGRERFGYMDPMERKMAETQDSERPSISTKLQRIAKVAREKPQLTFTSLAHHIDLDWLMEAYKRTRKDGATGVDDQTAADYAEDLEGNLKSLLERMKSGTYKAPPVLRKHIPKGTGKELRPLGIPTFEDKVAQRTVAMILEAVFEQDFLDCSHGFRPGRRAHDALRELRKQVMGEGGCWLVEVDLRKFFDTVDHAKLREILRARVNDGVLIRLIGKWLNAGVMEEGRVSYPETGTPQGGVISPLLANIYLHYVLDKWFGSDVKPRLRGHAFMIRYADDFVMGFECEDDARKVMAVLVQRCAKYGLTVHPTKTRLIDYRSPDDRGQGGSGGEPTSFSFLGFTHFWGKSRWDKWILQRKTAADRFTRSARALSHWCAAHRHWKVRDQHAALCKKLQGHYQYFGITGNWSALIRFMRAAERLWKGWLGRRSQQVMTWERFKRILVTYPLPTPRISHRI